MEERLFIEYKVGLQEIKTHTGFPAALHGPYHIACYERNGQSIWMVNDYAAESFAKHPMLLSSNIMWSATGRQVSHTLFWMAPVSHATKLYIEYVSNEATGIHITTTVLRHCRRSQKDLPKLGSCRAGRDSLNVLFITCVLRGPTKNFHIYPLHKSNTDPQP